MPSPSCRMRYPGPALGPRSCMLPSRSACAGSASPPAADGRAAAAPAAPTRHRHHRPRRARSPGSIAHQGKDDENGVALALEQANAKKLVIGGKPVTFRMMSEDDQGDPKVGTTVAQKFVDAKVAAVIGHLNSGVTIPASEIYAKAGIPVISGSATNPDAHRARPEGRLPHRRAATTSRARRSPPTSRASSRRRRSRSSTTRPRTARASPPRSRSRCKAAKVDGRRARAHDRQGNRLQGDPHAASRRRTPDVVFHGAMDATGGPMVKQARELGIKAPSPSATAPAPTRWRSSPAPRPRASRARRPGCPRDGREHASSSPPSTRSTARPSSTRRSSTTPTNVVIEAMQQGRFRRIPARFMPEIYNVSLTRRHRQDRVRRQGRPQGRRDDDLPHAGRQDRPGRRVSRAVTTPFIR